MELNRSCGDRYRLAWHLGMLAFTTYVGGDLASARMQGEENLAIFQDLGIQDGIAVQLNHIATGEAAVGNYARAAVLIAEALAVARTLGDRIIVALVLHSLGNVRIMQGQYAQAEALATECLALRHELGDRRGAVAIYELLAKAALGGGGLARAQTSITKGMQLALALQQPERAARLLSADEALREAQTILIWPDERPFYERDLALLHAALGEEGLAAAWAAGRALSLDEAMAEALDGADTAAV